MGNPVQLDYTAEEFPRRARELIDGRVSFQFCLAGDHFIAVSQFLHHGELEVGSLVVEPRLRMLAMIVLLAEGGGCQATVTSLADRLQIDINARSLSKAPLPTRSVEQVLPIDHLNKMRDASDQIHDACDFLLLDSPNELLRINHVNGLLHHPYRGTPWPDFLVAFASHGCGDYYAYDLRSAPPTILYIEPGNTVDDSLGLSNDNLQFASFADWYAHIMSLQLLP
ncbi:MAG: hypothetical protein ACOY0T_03190 [Myxococcota bacterium]